jgi:3-methyladenine DNA glycosylase AlkD
MGRAMALMVMTMGTSSEPLNEALANSAAELASSVSEELRRLGTRERAEKEKAYLKSDLVHFGASAPKIRSVIKPIVKGIPPGGHDELLALAASLWSEPVFDRRFAAAAMLADRPELLSSRDLPQLEVWLREARTWALVDMLTPYPVGHISQVEPVPTEVVLDRWATDEDFWIRRAALLAHLIPLRRGEGDWLRFTRYADAMLEEKEFFIRKAIGWVLRDASRKQPERVRDWVAPRTGRMSGVTIREAVKRLDPQDREEFLVAYREKRPAV